MSDLNSSLGVIETMPSRSDSLELTICRFCESDLWQGSTSSRLLFPCGCRQPVHNNCLVPEMEKQMKGQIQRGGKSRHYKCNKCNGEVKFEAEEHLRCRECAEIGRFRRSRSCLCAFLVIGSILLFLLVVLLVVLRSAEQILSNSVTLNAVTIGLAIGAGLLFAIILYLCVAELWVAREFDIRLTPSPPKQRKNSTLQIHELP